MAYGYGSIDLGALLALGKAASLWGKGMAAPKGSGSGKGGAKAKGAGKNSGKGKGGLGGGWQLGGKGKGGGQQEWHCALCNGDQGTWNRATRVVCRRCHAPHAGGKGGPPPHHAFSTLTTPTHPTRRGAARTNSATTPFAALPNQWRPTTMATATRPGGSGANSRTTADGGTTQTARRWSRAARAVGERDGDDGFTVVCKARGQRPRVHPTPGAAPAAGRGDGRRSDAGTRFHALATDDDDDDDGEGGNIDVDDVGGHDDEGQEDGDVQDYESDDEEQHQSDPLEEAREELRRRKENYNEIKTKFGRTHQATKMAYDDVQRAQRQYQQARGPKPWHVEASHAARKAEARERAAEKVKAEMDEHARWFDQLRCEAMAQRELYQQRIDELLDEAKEYRTQSATAAAEGAYTDHGNADPPEADDDDFDGDGFWHDDDDPNDDVDIADLAQDLAAAQDMAQQEGSAELQKRLAGIGARMARTEARGGIRSNSRQKRWQNQETPPWRTRGTPPTAAHRHAGADGKARGMAASTGASATTGRATSKTGDGNSGKNSEKQGDEHAADSPKVQAAKQAAEAAAARAAAAAEAAAAARRNEAEARRVAAMDKLRAIVQVEKQRLIEAKQAEAGVQTLENAQAWTPEQLAEHTRQIEEINNGVEAEAERRFAQMSEEEKQKLLEDAWW